MRPIREILGVLRAYTSHPDPLVASANVVALLVASSQPLYPLYFYWLVSDQIAPTFFTYLSTPFFFAVPAVARISTLAGRALLPLTGIANTVLCAWLFGVESAVEIFLIPCAVLALLLFRPKERTVGLAIAGLAFAAFIFLRGLYGAPMVAYSSAEYEAFIRLNAMSAAALTCFTALIFSNLLADEASRKSAGDREAG